MIKGSIEERLEYEEYIRSLKDIVRYPFRSIYHESQKIIRYFWIKKAKENREFQPNEIHILHLMSVIDTAVRVGGLIYAYWWEEFMPKAIFDMPQSKVDWFVPATDMASVFMNVPTKTVEAALLKSNASREIIYKALKAQREDDMAMLTEQLSLIPLDSIFGAFKLIYSYQLQCELISQIDLLDDVSEHKMIYVLADSYEAVKANDAVDTQDFIDIINEWVKPFDFDDEKVKAKPEPYIFAISVGLMLIKECFNGELGESDPIAETIREITEEESFRRIFNHYVQFPRDTEKCLAICRRYIEWLNKITGININIEEFDSDTFTGEDRKPVFFDSFQRLDFPTRLINGVSPSPIYADKRELILSEIFKVYGKDFENMTCEDFVYLFGGTNKAPSTYNPPYYWAGPESALKAILKVLYIRQPRSLKRLILHSSDRENGITGHDWGKNKDKVAYLDKEEKIIEIVSRINGKTLKRL